MQTKREKLKRDESKDAKIEREDLLVGSAAHFRLHTVMLVLEATVDMRYGRYFLK